MSFVVGDSYFRQEKWKESIQPLEDFVGEKIKDRKKPKVRLVPTSIPPSCNWPWPATASTAEKAPENLLLLTEHYPGNPHLPLALSEQGRLAPYW